MAIRLSDLRSKTKTLEGFAFAGEAVAVQYKAYALTPGLLADMNASSERQVTLICEVVTAWDLTDDQGVPVPLTPVAVRTVPLVFLDELGGAIMDDMRPKARKESS